MRLDFEITSDPNLTSYHQKAMMADIQLNTLIESNNQSNTFIWQNRVILSLDFLKSSRGLYLGHIKAKKCGLGHGKQALNWLREVSNKHGVFICLDAVADENNDEKPFLNQEKLCLWYRKRKFIEIKKDTFLYFPKP